MNVLEIAKVVFFLIPVLAMVIVEVLKRIPAMPVTSKNAKLAALVVSTVLVIGDAYMRGTLIEALAIQNALEIVAVYVASIGIYESFKALIAKI